MLGILPKLYPEGLPLPFTAFTLIICDIAMAPQPAASFEHELEHEFGGK